MLVLASTSPRRSQLLSSLGYTYTVEPAIIPEETREGESPEAYVQRLAAEKAHSVASRMKASVIKDDVVVLAADTAVVFEGQILGKPTDMQDANEMLQKLCNRIHQVYTGIAIYSTGIGRLSGEVCKSQVLMRNYEQDEIDQYITSGDPMDKAGAYAIQHRGFHPVEQIKGCYTNIVGLPLCRVVHVLEEMGIHITIPLKYTCLSGESGICSFMPSSIVI